MHLLTQRMLPPSSTNNGNNGDNNTTRTRTRTRTTTYWAAPMEQPGSTDRSSVPKIRWQRKSAGQ